MRRFTVLGAGLAALGLLVTVAGEAGADQVRSAEWPLTAFHAAQRVWPHSTGKDVVVAVIDSGVRATHEDLTGQVLPGKDFSSGGNGWTDTDPDGHGTAMASLIAGHGHGPSDADGTQGLAPGAEILPLTVGSASTSDFNANEVIEAIRYATDHGAKVINLSLGSPIGSDAEEQAIAYAEAHDVVVVAGAGNSGVSVPNYPAAYPGVVSVTAVDTSGKLWANSNYGDQITLAAPGVHIVAAGAGSDSEHRLSDGTSDATAYVSAAAALVRSAFPKLTAGQVINRLIKTAANPDGAGHDPRYGYGILRPDAALTFTIPAGPAAGPLPQISPPIPAASSSPVPASSTKTTGLSPYVVYGAAGFSVIIIGVGGVALIRRRARLDHVMRRVQ